MTAPSSYDVPQLLLDWSDGDKTALDRLMPLVYAELRRLAHHHMRREYPGHTLQTTALVNEIYLKLIDQNNVHWQNRAHFFAIAAQLMRRILVDYARSRLSAKRGGGARKVTLDDVAIAIPEPSADLLALDEAMVSLAEVDARKSQIVEMKFFGGLSVEEMAQALGVSPVTVMRDLRSAKAWIGRAIKKRATSKT